MQLINIQKWHHTHQDRIHALSFYLEEIGTLRKRLETVVPERPGEELRTRAEHFENCFALHKKKINRLVLSLNKSLAMLNREGELFTDFFHSSFHRRLQSEAEEFEEEERQIAALRQSFSLFCTMLKSDTPALPARKGVWQPDQTT